jgi:hypothetical protein
MMTGNSRATTEISLKRSTTNILRKGREQNHGKCSFRTKIHRIGVKDNNMNKTPGTNRNQQKLW